ncbi:hypothetical protein KJ742_02330 [Patescibacteria group bacterium]|nr:hypothetical protein [Patescibacteria group bacterium]MBU1682758.1 hypothetical protein [Patescibacteria group bacterium]MBU1935219.1 hypothetical protein [Patescibacteria group bacterium]
MQYATATQKAITLHSYFVLCIILITLFFAINYSYAEDIAHEFSSTSECLGESYLSGSIELDEIDGNVVVKNKLLGPRSYGFIEAESLISFIVPKKDTYILSELDSLNSADAYLHFTSIAGKHSLQTIPVSTSGNDLIYGISKEEFESLLNNDVCLITALENKPSNDPSDESGITDSIFLYMNGIHRSEEDSGDIDESDDNSLSSIWSYIVDSIADSSDKAVEEITQLIKHFWFFVNQPKIALEIGIYKIDLNNISSIAGRFALNSQLTNENNGYASKRNAFRHILWQAMIAKEFGEEIAIDAGNAHEINSSAIDGNEVDEMYFDKAKDADQSVDLRNNIIGRSIGLINKDKSAKELAIITLNYFRDSGLWVAEKQDNDLFQIKLEKLSLEVYGDVLYNVSNLDEYGR